MHTIKVLACGFLLLGLCLLAGRLFGNSRSVTLGALVFVPLWLIVAGANMYFGMKRVGYTFLEELPIFFCVFLLPALPALIVAWTRGSFGR
ncbi:MAG TPA: hypothetical protein VGC07_11245 [Granulicella sp.]